MRIIITRHPPPRTVQSAANVLTFLAGARIVIFTDCRFVKGGYTMPRNKYPEQTVEKSSFCRRASLCPEGLRQNYLAGHYRHYRTVQGCRVPPFQIKRGDCRQGGRPPRCARRRRAGAHPGRCRLDRPAKGCKPCLRCHCCRADSSSFSICCRTSAMTRSFLRWNTTTCWR